MAPSSALVAHGVQVAIEGGFAAHRHRLALGHHGPVVTAPGRIVHPGAVGLAEVLDQPLALAAPRCRRWCAGANLASLTVGLRADAIDLAHRQGPDLRLHVFGPDHRDAIGLVEFAGHLGKQLVRRHADRAGQARLLEDGALDQPRQRAAAFALAPGHVREIDVDLVHATIFHHRRDLGDAALEQARVPAHLLEVHRQHDGLRAELGGLHHAHGRTHAELARRHRLRS